MPLLVVASDGDGVINMAPRETAYGYFAGVAAAVDALPVPVERFDAGTAPALAAAAPPPAAAFLRLREPNHISFLSARTNDALVRALRAFLPLAKRLDLSVLDFDKYDEARDSGPTAEVVVPAVVNFVKTHLEGA